ncbi:beta strand repeat-containing protein [Planctomycetes bacterium K23_9]|uniref:Uncharacterized protein n=1 Tax=Stieleria marina TaxID=1930275 RepID=A0A517NWJ1_9BACT|nr:hypothetical protein K239x_34540 [Planctomycetes bacterium K23_9]
MVWQRLTRRWKNDDQPNASKKKRRRRLSMESLAKRELLASDFGAITGTAYNDANDNGIFDAGEVALANVNISITGPVAASTTTNASGEYRFDDLTAGNYQVTQDPPAPTGFNPAPGESPRAITVTVGDAAGQSLITIDDFDGTTQTVDAVSTGTNPNSSSVGDAAVIGGTRDLFVTVTSATGSATVSSNPGSNPGFLEINPSSTAAATYLFTYDGDNDATTLTANGLSTDLTQGGNATAVQAVLGFDIDPASTANGTFGLTFHTDAANSTTYTFALPDTAGAPTAELLIRYNGAAELINGASTINAAISQTGAGADFTNIGAIQLALDSDGEAAVDGIIDFLRAIGPTEIVANFANDEITPLVNIEKSTNTIDADTGTGPLLGVGTTATFQYVVTNPGNTALGTVTVTDDQGVTPVLISGDTNSNNILETTETWIYEATATVTEGQYTNIGTVTGNPVDANGDDIAGLQDPTDTDPSNHFGARAEIDIEKSTNTVDADTGTGPQLGVGTTATFQYVVTNTGNVSLATVTVTDDQGVTPVLISGDTNSNNILETTETWIFEATATVTAGQYTNIGTTSGNPVDDTGADIANLADPTATDPSNHFGVAAGIQIEKDTNGVQADTGTGPQLIVGSTATFTYVVTNTGSTSLGSVAVTDDQGVAVTFVDGDTNSNGILETTETWNYTGTSVVTAGQYNNVGTVVGTPVDGTGTAIPGLTEINDTDPSAHFGVTASIQIEKDTNGSQADTGTGPQLAVGSTATFTYVVTNTGTASLGSVNVSDDQGVTVTFVSGDTNSNGILETTETWTYTGTRTVTAGQYNNIGTVTGNPVDGNGTDIAGATDVTDTDPSAHIGITPSIQIEKDTNGEQADTGTGPQLAVGSTATFTYVVTNPGTTPIGSVAVTDDQGVTITFVGGDTNSNNVLESTETWTYTGTRTVTAGQYNNIGTVTGTPVDANGTALPGVANVSDTDPSAHIGIAPEISLEKATNGQDADTATGPQLAVGSTATFTYVVTNPGATALGSVTLTDDQGVTTTLVSGDTNNNNILETTETWTFQGTTTVTVGQYTNIGTVSGNPVDANGNDLTGFANVTDTDPSNHIGVASTINIEKATNGQDSDAPTGQRLEVGSTATFSYVVTNTGLSLSNVVVVDDGGTSGVTTDDFTPTFNGGDTNNNGQLDQGESWLYSATRIVTLGQYTNVATVTADNPGGGNDLTDSDASNHLGITPGGQLSKRDFLASTT